MSASTEYELVLTYDNDDGCQDCIMSGDTREGHICALLNPSTYALHLAWDCGANGTFKLAHTVSGLTISPASIVNHYKGHTNEK